MTKWKTTDHGQYIEVMPITDTREHFAGDECWCTPCTERKAGSIPVISHNAVSDMPTERPDTKLRPSGAQSNRPQAERREG